MDDIDLSVPAGEIFGLLGPDGAGKTTTISICTTRALPPSGMVLESKPSTDWLVPGALGVSLLLGWAGICGFFAPRHRLGRMTPTGSAWS